MKRISFHLCSFSSLDELNGKNRTYENVKALALKIGKFSAFDPLSNKKDGDIFNRLVRDSEIETWDLGYPWTGVRKRQVVDE